MKISSDTTFVRIHALSALVLTLLTLSAAPAARAQTVTFTNIADTNSPEFANFDFAAPTINNGGTVAFSANRDAGVGGGRGIYKATNASGFITVALTSTPGFANFGFVATINDGGVVAFQGNSGGINGIGIYTAVDSSSFTPIALSSSPEFGNLDSSPKINNSGVVAFNANRDSGGDGLYTATDSSGFTTLARTDTSPEFNTLNLVNINSVGVVAFIATRDAGVGGGEGIYTATDTGSFTTIARTDTSTQFDGLFGPPAINSGGTVAFRARRDGAVGGNEGLFTATDSSSFTTIALANTSPEFESFANIGINDNGTIVFSAIRKAGVGGGQGIYVKPSSALTPSAVIRTGDTLFGSTVTQVSFVNAGLATTTDALSFRYTLANGVTGVARANISAAAPEPGSLALITVGITSLGGFIARRRRSGR